MKSLRKQLFNNGRGFGSYLFTCCRNGTVSKKQVAFFVIRAWFIGWFMRSLVWPRSLPRWLILNEIMGALYSPWAYRASQKHARHHSNQLFQPLTSVISRDRTHSKRQGSSLPNEELTI
jgi:hypothetical protein